MRPTLSILVALLATSALVPAAHADDDAPRWLTACLVGVGADAGAVNVLLLLRWDDARGVWAGEMHLYFMDGILTGREGEVYRVIAYEIHVADVDGDGTTRFFDVVEDWENGERAPVYLVGSQAAGAPVAGFFGTAGAAGASTLTGTV